ncbi:hypothetical protein ASE74_24015 [Pedobacter sp. Leaf216]|uniref:hypothetical protein n=1 Tax=Pedobacter sp. Leaf216 TaxID=1735684 RepID=UPI0006F2E2D9|nr:hypothetical protein [Pedobacter sp. Leaf216]KQM68543.1 hypothetical protein ASE74_24015 [Pedobacter sp. Leaf216]
MIKLINIVILNFLFMGCTVAQPGKKIANSYNGILLTRYVSAKYEQENERDTSKILYVHNTLGDSLFVYKVAGGILSEATAYVLTSTNNGLNLHIKSVLSNSDVNEGLKVIFQDSDHSVLINQNDRYILYPKFYSLLKQQVEVKHSILSLFDFLEDYIEDYEITDIYPILLSANQGRWEKKIQQSKVTVKRSQSQLKDTWNFKYQYNNKGNIESVKAASADEVHFSKKISYLNPAAIEMTTYRNNEDRQITSRKAVFSPSKSIPLKWKDNVEETGKNLETEIFTTIARKSLSKIKLIHMTQAEVLKLVRQVK